MAEWIAAREVATEGQSTTQSATTAHVDLPVVRRDSNQRGIAEIKAGSGWCTLCDVGQECCAFWS